MFHGSFLFKKEFYIANKTIVNIINFSHMCNKGNKLVLFYRIKTNNSINEFTVIALEFILITL